MAHLDITRSFDLINHALLLQKLELYKCDRDTNLVQFILIFKIPKSVYQEEIIRAE